MLLYLLLSALVSQDDSELIKRLKERDPEAMKDLYDRFGKVALAIITRIVRDRAIAEDLLQETFLKVWNRVAGFDVERGALGPWVLTIARNRAIDYRRSTSSRFAQAGYDVEKLDRPFLFIDLEEQYADRDRLRHIQLAFSKLTDNQKSVLEMAYFEGLTQSEMADRLKQPLGTVKTWVRTALQILRQELGEAAAKA
ncbi:MAG: sigma-70 family RNA polymerase sigma factor [Bryobacteraceae bacterium]